MFFVDAGNHFAKGAKVNSQELPQQVEKARVMAKALAHDGIDAMLLAEGDLAVGIDVVRALQSEHALPYVATNLQCPEPFHRNERVIARAGVRVGVLGVVGKKAEIGGCTVMEAEVVLAAAVADLRPRADVIVLLDALSEPESKALLKTLTGVDLVVGGTPQSLANPENTPSGGLRLGPGTKGRNLGMLNFTLTEGATVWRETGTLARLASQRDRFVEKVAQAKAEAEKATAESTKAAADKRAAYYQVQADEAAEKLAAATATSARAHQGVNTLTALDDGVKDHPEVAGWVTTAKAAIASAGRSEASAASLGPYVGSSACAACHPAETEQWRTTAHSRAYASLVTVNRQLDQACFACHVTGAVALEGGEVLGATSPHTVGTLTNVGCESCHGPGNLHVGNPVGVQMHTLVQADCVVCHDSEQDGGRFDYGVYLPKVVHR